MRKFLEGAREAARIGAAVVAKATARGKVPSFKGATDLVTATDKASERAIARFLARRFPEHGFLGEEGGQRGNPHFRWVVDPLDGTMNFAHGYPYYDVSVGLESGGTVLAGAIADPSTGQLWSAARGMGAFLDGKRIRVSKRRPLRSALLATGFSSAFLESGKNNVSAQFRRFERLCLDARGVRRPGAAALDLAFVASGVFDGFWESGLCPWDIAAGLVIIEEAGGRVTDFSGRPAKLFGRDFLASNGLVHSELLARLR